MALQKQPVNINFSSGLDTKSDPKQVQLGKFLKLSNSVFDKAGALVKRNGFKDITQLPNAVQTTLTTLNGNLIATGSNLYAYASSSNQWLDQGTIQPVQLDAISLVRNSTAQTSPDTASTADGLTALVYMDNAIAYYHVIDKNTGYQVVERTSLGSATTCPRAFLLGAYFIITYIDAASSLNYIAIPTTEPTNPSTPRVWSASVSGANSGYDGVVSDSSRLYIAWANSSGSTELQMMDQFLAFPTAPVTVSAHSASLVSVVEDKSRDIIYVTYYAGTTLYTAAYDYFLALVLAETSAGTLTINQLTSVALNGLLTIIYQTTNTYAGITSAARTDFLSEITVTQLGVVSGSSVIVRSVGLASKAFMDSQGVIYMMAVFQEANQNTYFLIDSHGSIYMRLAATNAGGYTANQVLPSVEIIAGVHTVPYLITDFLTTVNKNTPPGTAQINAIYTQTGVNLASFELNTFGQYSSEIAGALHLTGGQLWEYDGVKPVEQGFHVFPSPNSASTNPGGVYGAISTSGTGGLITAGTYYYAFTYEWTDNQGNLHRSAPSLPISIVTTGSTSSTTIHVPTLRLTAKFFPNPVRIVGYRWSLDHQTYYQFTSVTSPIINDLSVDSIAIVDTLSDLSILGNTLLYTTGGVIENIAAPASIHSTLYKNRLFLIDAEDRNLLWFSKQVIEAVPVEMSDLLTIYVAPTTGAQGSTGPMTALSVMDDKLIIFKKDAIYYITGTGPDNTGANNDFSDPTFITSSVGCPNPASIVLMPNGIMFQSDKGIWLLGRDLQTQYIGAPVEEFNKAKVNSAKSIPATNQVRFTLDNNIDLIYDYFFGQWGTFSNVFSISSTLFQGQHTYLNKYGHVFQETPNTYLDGSSPVLMSLTTSWINIAGVQGYERFYEMYLLGTYFTPFKLNLQIAYDYNTSATQSTTILPDNYSRPWGGEAQWGSGAPWGGPGNVFEARLFPQKQKCESFQIVMQEIFDPQFNTVAGQGLNLSGFNLIVGVKKGSRTQKAGQSFG